jgi:hypothetical protein
MLYIPQPATFLKRERAHRDIHHKKATSEFVRHYLKLTEKETLVVILPTVRQGFTLSCVEFNPFKIDKRCQRNSYFSLPSCP